MKNKWWRSFVTIVVTYLVSGALFVLSLTIETNKFYNNPDHIGFAIPVFSLLLLVVLFLICVTVTVVSLVKAVKRYKER